MWLNVTKLNGYFIGTCYDGQTIFDEFKRKRRSELEITERGKKVWKITKLYEEDIFEPNDSSLGYKIDVYQESINQTLSEYLVNFAFLTRVMEDYGFVIISRQEAYQMGLQNGSSMFVELYELMMKEIKKNPNVESNYGEAPFMRDYERDISFYNRYFIFKKVRTIDADKLTRGFLAKLPDEVIIEEKGTKVAQEIVKQEVAIKPKVKKLSKKIVLQAATEALEEKPLIIEQPLADETAQPVLIQQPLAESQAPLLEEEVDIQLPLPTIKKKTTKKKVTIVPLLTDIVDEE